MLLVAAFAASPSLAQTYSFEPPEYSGAAGGMVLTGQNGWYLPPSSTDFRVFTSTGNSYGFTTNPAGDTQFGAGSGAGFPARAERSVSFTGASGAPRKGAWQVSWDVSVVAPLVSPLTNTGSFTLQPSAIARVFLSFYRLSGQGTTFRVMFAPFDAAGSAYPQPGLVPHPGFDNLPLNTWHRVTVLFAFDTNRIHRISVQDLSTGVSSTVVNPTIPENGSLYYLGGGATPAASVGPPSAMRLFASGVEATVMAFDNLLIFNCLADCTYDGALTIADFGCFQGRFAQGDPYGDCNGDNRLTIADFACFQAAFAAGCF